MKKTYTYAKRLCALLIAFCMLVGVIPAGSLEGIGTQIAHAAETQEYELNNGYLKVTVSPEKGGFGIRTVLGDKINKSDNDKYLVYEYDEDHTSFTSFQVTQGGQTKEYIFGGTYYDDAGQKISSDVSVSRKEEELLAVWSVGDLTFTQTLRLVNTGENEHGAVLISYTVANAGDPAQVKCRILMDTALGYRDYAYYNVGNTYINRETALVADGEKDCYEKVFYAVNDPSDPTIVAYTINASIEQQECKPYQTIFGHWSNLASSVFDYVPDGDMTFTNAYNIQYRTSDSAYALYFDMGEVATSKVATIGTNYGVYSNESVKEQSTVAVNVAAPDVLNFAVVNGEEDQSTYENGGMFSVKTYISNISDKDYEKIRIMIYTTGGVDPVYDGERQESTYEDPFYIENMDFTAGEQMEYDWSFIAEPQAVGQYTKIHYKVYDVSDSATQNTGLVMVENLLGEGYTYVLCPGSVNMIPQIKFTGSSPDTVYTDGIRNLYITGENFSMLETKTGYSLMLSRVDGAAIHGQPAVQIPNELFRIDASTNVMTVILTEDAPGRLEAGMYQLTVDYADPLEKDISGAALRFQVSAEEEYRNETYGYVAVVKETDMMDDIKYTIQRYVTEEEYWEAIEGGLVERTNVLLEFQGSFTKEESDDGSVIYSGLSLSDTDNIMTLNGCLDIRNGTVTITETDGSVTVDFDADIYTTGENTAVWSGMCALTELEKGTEYNLVPYDEDGNREDMVGDTITLLWPSVGQGFQSLAGMLFELKYGELGTIRHEDGTGAGAETRVVAFGAAMDLSFLIPDASDVFIIGRAGKTKDILGTSWDAAEHNTIKWTPEEIRVLNKRANYRSNTVETDTTAEEVEKGKLVDITVDDSSGYNSATIVIDDILFGGEYLGLNMAVGLGIPPYIQGMPALETLVEIHTVGNWSFAVDGQCHFTSFSMQVSIDILNNNDKPIPNKLTFFLGGITPGINIDGVGVLWLQGGGGGIDNLYDTIFLTEKVPPLKLILSAQFSVLQVISATATMGISLRGFDLSLANGRTMEATNEETQTVIHPIPITFEASMQVDWHPEFYFQGVVNLILAKIIEGGGYVVADAEGFFEFFLRAAVRIPTDVPIFGGIELAEVNLGVNDVKIWGQASALDLVIGVTYYWGDGFDWDNGSRVYPTYPELVGIDVEEGAVTFAIDRNEQTGKTLFMTLGTNVRQLASTGNMTNDINHRQTFQTQKDVLETNDIANSTAHTMQLAKNGSSKLLLIQWTAASEAAAKEAVTNTIRIYDKVKAQDATYLGDTAYSIQLVDTTKDTAHADNVGANANLTFSKSEEDEKNGTVTASLAISFTKASAYGIKWGIQTPVGAVLTLYDVAPMPQVSMADDAVSIVPVTDAVSGETVDAMRVTIRGTEMDQFDTLTLFAEGEDVGASTFLGRAEKTAEEPFRDEVTMTFGLPETLSSGKYTLRVVARDAAAKYHSEASAPFTYTNPKQPQPLAGISVTNAGDYKVAVTVEDGAEDTYDGYVFTVKDASGNPVSGVDQLYYYKDGSELSYQEDGTIAAYTGQDVAEVFVIGGHYEYPYTDIVVNEETGLEEEVETTVVAGLSAGKYTVEARRWKRLADGTGMLRSEAVTAEVTVVEPKDTKILVAGETAAGVASTSVTVVRGEGSANENSYSLMSYASGDITLTLTPDQGTIAGTWELDGGTRRIDKENGEQKRYYGTVEALTDQISLSFTDLTEGTHQLHFVGHNEQGDAVAATYQFMVDTIGPRLMLSEPSNGGLFDYWTGRMTVSGISDGDGILTIVDNTTGQTLLAGAKISDLQQDGSTFTTEIVLDRRILSHDLTIAVKDALGNETVKEVNVNSNGLGSMEELLIFALNSKEAIDITGSENVTNTKLPVGVTYELALMAKLKRPEGAAADAEDLYVEINKAGMVDWVQEVAEGEMEMADKANGVTVTTHKGTEGMVTARFLVNDEGAYTVSTAFGKVEGRYVITLPTQTVGYTVQTEQSVSVDHGDSFSFTVTIHDGFVAGKNFKVMVNGKEIWAVNGVYTIDYVDCDMEVTVSGVELKLPDSIDPTPSNPTQSPSEPTGDDSPLWLWITLVLLSGSGLISLGWVERKRRMVK